MFDALNLLWLKLLSYVLKILHITWSISKMATVNQVQTKKMLYSKLRHLPTHIDSLNNLKIEVIFRESVWGKLLLKIPKIGLLILFWAERKTCGLILVTLALIGENVYTCIFFLEEHILYFRQGKDYLKMFLFPTCGKWGWRLAPSWRISYCT